MDILHEVIIGIISGFIGYKVERYLEDKIKSKWLCWILSIIITIIVIVIPVLVIRILIAGD